MSRFDELLESLIINGPTTKGVDQLKHRLNNRWYLLFKEEYIPYDDYSETHCISELNDLLDNEYRLIKHKNLKVKL